MTGTAIVGIDCSTNPGKLGLARGLYEGERSVVYESRVGVTDPVDLIAGWIECEASCLLAIDAPLGWPQPMGQLLARHEAGSSLEEDANMFFRRYTDRFIKDVTNKQPLDVGSNLIARTAHFALNLLQSVRDRTGKPIPMAWRPSFGVECAVIEVYPAATLEARGLSSLGYKKHQELPRREELAKALSRDLAFEVNVNEVVATDDTFDAALCLLAASDFLNDRCYYPAEEKLAQAKKESWIWVSKPQ